jgi:hypothetical protein
MSHHLEEVSAIPSHAVDQSNNSQLKLGRMSRRRFLRSAAIGAGAAALALQGANVALADEETTGDTTFDALLITYVGAPIGCNSSTQWSYSKNRSNTFKLALTAEAGVSLKADTSGTTSTGTDKSKFTVGTSNSVTFKQNNSAMFTDAIFTRESSSRTLNTTVRGTVADAGDTVFFGLLRPTATFTGNPVAGFKYRFLNATDTFTWPAYRFQQRDATTVMFFKDGTITSFLNQYPPTSAITPVEQPGSILRKPRFKLVESNFAAAGTNQSLNRTLSTGASFSLALTSVFSAEITSSSGFELTNGSTTVKSMFSVGKTFSLTVSGVQEVTTENVISLTANFVRATDGVTKIYRDKVWKTFVILDAGLPGPTAVQGRVTDASGFAISEATVYLQQGNTYYSTSTDANGNYALKATAGQPLTAGSCPITCGNVNQNVTIGSNGTSATPRHFSGVDPYAARNPLLDLALLE